MSIYASVAAVREACAICGKATKSRCSGCLDAGGPSIFFCSPEHQKLVWHNHKFVCRDKSASFIMPPLSDEEFQRFEHFARQEVLHRDDTDSGKTFASYFEANPRFGLVEGEVHSRIVPSLTSFDHYERAEQQMWLMNARGMSANFYESASVRHMPDVRVHTIWELVAWISVTVLRLLPLSEVADSKQAFTLVQHHALVFSTLLQLKAASSVDNFNKEWIRLSFEHLTGAIDAAACSEDVGALRELANTLTGHISQVGCGLKAAAVYLA